MTLKATTVLRYLVAHVGQMVTKEELFAAAWPDTVVSDAALTTCVQEVRQALHDDARKPRYLETVYRRGFRFLPAVTAQPVQSPKSKVQSQKEVVNSQHSVVSRKEGARGWRLETSPLSPPASSPQSPVSTIVGREADLTQLHGWLEKALSGERQLVFVTGEPGIGKTTLVNAFRRRLEARDLLD